MLWVIVMHAWDCDLLGEVLKLVGDPARVADLVGVKAVARSGGFVGALTEVQGKLPDLLDELRGRVHGLSEESDGATHPRAGVVVTTVLVAHQPERLTGYRLDLLRSRSRPDGQLLVLFKVQGSGSVRRSALRLARSERTSG